MMLARDVAFLCGYSLFNGVPATEIMVLLAGASVEVCSPGVSLSEQGSISDRLCIIVEGDAVVTERAMEGRERHIASLSGGDVFGEISLLESIPKVATVRAATPCRYLAIPREEVERLLETAPVFRERLQRLARRRRRDGTTAVA
jgi:CRP-like cAMP-binding protein